MEAYLHDLDIVQEFAAWNRQAIADDICKRMKLSPMDSFSCVHNYFDTENKILRKGAISAQENEKVIIPMNMRDGCLLGVAKGNEEWNFSAPHGAGRLLSRQEARNSFTPSQFKKEMQGIYSNSVSRDTLDESHRLSQRAAQGPSHQRRLETTHPNHPRLRLEEIQGNGI